MRNILIVIFFHLFFIKQIVTEEKPVNMYGYFDFNIGSIFQPNINGNSASYSEVAKSDDIVVNGKDLAPEVIAIGLSIRNDLGHLMDIAIEPKGTGFSVSDSECNEIIVTYNSAGNCQGIDRISMYGLNLALRYQYLLIEKSAWLGSILNDKYFFTLGLLYSTLWYDYESSKLLNTSTNETGFGFLGGINIAFETKIFTNDIPVLYLIGLEVRYNPMSFPKLNRKIQDLHFSIPIRLAISLF